MWGMGSGVWGVAEGVGCEVRGVAEGVFVCQ